MDILSIHIAKIDIESRKVENIKPEAYGTDFENYLKDLVRVIISKGKGRNFKFDRDSTEVRGKIGQLMDDGNFDEISLSIAKRLLEVEEDAQQKIAKLDTEVQKGILVQAIVEELGVKKFVICKADHTEFLNEKDFKYSKGLPLKKKVFKAFVCTMTAKKTVTHVLVYDSNAHLARYWWKDFLELTKVYTDEDNTENAFESLERNIFSDLKKKHPQDYVYLRNSVVRYFRAKESFDMDDFLDNAIGKYEPYDSNLDIDEIKTKIEELPDKARMPFDQQFSIKKEKITARFLNKIPLTKQIDLYIKEDIPNIHNVISAFKDRDGTKYVKIKSESGYELFNKT